MEGGLYLLVRSTGGKSWKYDFRLGSTRGSYTIGTYPEISLKDARASHIQAREHVTKGIHPKEIKIQAKVKTDKNTKRFSHYCWDWFNKQNQAETTRKKLKQQIENNLIAPLDKRRIDEFSTLDLLKILKPISERGSRESAIRLASVLRRVFNEALILGIIENNPAQGLNELLPKPDPKLKGNFAHITSAEELKVILNGIDNPSPRQDYAVTMALKLMPLVFLRPWNIRHLRWEYIDFNNHVVELPPSEMKKNHSLTVPLSTQAEALLKEMQPLTGDKEYVFITGYGKDKPMSENTTTQALKRIVNPATGKAFGTGYMTSHGFRHSASTMLNEMGYSADAIELQLAHNHKDMIRAVYNKAKLIPERTMMMQEWANYLEKLKGN
jgi:integrase